MRVSHPALLQQTREGNKLQEKNMQSAFSCPPLSKERRGGRELYALLRSRRLAEDNSQGLDQAEQERYSSELRQAGYQHQRKLVQRGQHHQPRPYQPGHRGSRRQSYPPGQQPYPSELQTDEHRPKPNVRGQQYQPRIYQPKQRGLQGQQGHPGHCQPREHAQPVPCPTQQPFQSRSRRAMQSDQTGQHEEWRSGQQTPQQAERHTRLLYQYRAQQAGLWSYRPGTSYNLEPRDQEQLFYQPGASQPSPQPGATHKHYSLNQSHPQQVSWRSGTSTYRHLPAQALGSEPFLSELVRQQRQTSGSSGTPQAPTRPFPIPYFQNHYTSLPGTDQPVVYSLAQAPLSQDSLPYQQAAQNALYQGHAVVNVKPSGVGDDQTHQVLQQAPPNFVPQVILSTVPQLQPCVLQLVHSNVPVFTHPDCVFDQSAHTVAALSELAEAQYSQITQAANGSQVRMPHPHQAELPGGADVQEIGLYPTPQDTPPQDGLSSSPFQPAASSEVESLQYETPVTSDVEEETGGATVQVPASGIRSIRRGSNGVISISVTSLSALRFEAEPVTVSADDVAEDLQSFDSLSLQRYIGSLDTPDLVGLLESLDSLGAEGSDGPASRVQTERYTSVHVYSFPEMAERASQSEDRETSNTTEEECPICLERYAGGVQVAVLPCSSPHHFHAECLRTWLRQSSTCPYCRNALPSYRRLRRL